MVRVEEGARTGSDESSRVKNQDAAARVAKGELHGGESFWRKVGVAAARTDGVQVQRELQTTARDGDGFGKGHNIHQTRYQVKDSIVVCQRQRVGKLRGRAHSRIAHVRTRLLGTCALPLRAAVCHSNVDGALQLSMERVNLNLGRVCLVCQCDAGFHSLPFFLHGL